MHQPRSYGPYRLVRRVRIRLLLGMAILFLLLLAAWCGATQELRPPLTQADRSTADTKTPARASGAQFSNERAFAHIREISRKPHPPGSGENERVREYIISEIQKLGYSPEVQSASSVRPRLPGIYIGGYVKNILVRVPGKAASPAAGPGAILLSAHYDSVFTGPGAGDNAAGVAVALEALRILKAGPPLERDLIVLFPDGEELGLLGAHAFLEKHRYAADIDFAVNLEARGVTGESILFQLGARDYETIRNYASASDSIIATSFAAEIYNLLPNDTDFTLYRERGFGGLNFAFIDGVTSYHSELDVPARLDPRSVRHHGENTLAALRQFGNSKTKYARNTEESAGLDKEGAIYFNFPRAFLIYYPRSYGRLFFALTFCIYILTLLFAYYKRRLEPSGILRGFLIAFVMIPLTAFASFGLWFLVTLVHTDYLRMVIGETYNGPIYRLAFVCLSIAICSLIYVRLRSYYDLFNLQMGAMFPWLILTFISLLYAPGASFLFQWPLLVSVLALWPVLFAWERKSWMWLGLAMFTPGAFFCVYLFSTILTTVFIGLTLQMSFLGGVLLALLAALLLPLQELLSVPYRRLLPLVSFVMLCSFLLAGGITSGHNRLHKLPTNVFYTLNLSQNKGQWTSCNKYQDEWSSQFLNAKNTRPGDIQSIVPLIKACLPSGNDFLTAPAPLPAGDAAGIKGPDLRVLRDRFDGKTRNIRLAISPLEKMPGMDPAFAREFLTYFSLKQDDAFLIQSAKLNGEELIPAEKIPELKPLIRKFLGKVLNLDRWWLLGYISAPPGGLVLDLVLETKDVNGKKPSLEIILAGQLVGLPVFKDFVYPAKPDDLMAGPGFPFFESSLIARTFRF